MINRFLLIGLVLVAVAMIGLQFTGDGMAACQIHHSFDVCHDSLN